ncbi:protein kinase family protein [Streptacidiphilus cavernicola]|uniref:Protein kinase family protein n=1 Tax=Streptacidiphilus cavernicola TaxID=3342716 RepID=A0ABV6W3I4_9ACTN
MSRSLRLAAHRTVSAQLARRSDQQLRELLETAAPLGTGIGGTVALLRLDGVPVFVKKVPLTDLERRPEHTRSTANLFDLPAFYHYGVGSAGFGAWRELAVHEQTTDWVLSGEADCFPLTYHWRVLDQDAPAVATAPTPEEDRELEDRVAFWEGSPAVRARLRALRESTASVVLFLEHIPHRLGDWLYERVSDGGRTGEQACAMVRRELATGTELMNSRGLQHFDAHFHNVLTDGQRLYFADFGLALSDRFDLAEPEAAFLRRHRSYDASYTATRLFNMIVSVEEIGVADTVVRAYADGGNPGGLPEPLLATARRLAPVALAVGGFYRGLRLESRSTPYPSAAVERACADAGLTSG